MSVVPKKYFNVIDLLAVNYKGPILGKEDKRKNEVTRTKTIIAT